MSGLPHSSRSRELSTDGFAYAADQGLTLLHFSAQLQRFLWDRGCIQGCLGGVYPVSGGIGGVHGALCVRNGSG